VNRYAWVHELSITNIFYLIMYNPFDKLLIISSYLWTWRVGAWINYYSI